MVSLIPWHFQYSHRHKWHPPLKVILFGAWIRPAQNVHHHAINKQKTSYFIILFSDTRTKKNWTYRSIKIFYHESDVKNDKMNWYWYDTVGDRSSGFGRISDPNKYPEYNHVWRGSVNDSILLDYVLLSKYEPGRYFEIVKSTSYFVISEILLTFSELREYFCSL